MLSRIISQEQFCNNEPHHSKFLKISQRTFSQLTKEQMCFWPIKLCCVLVESPPTPSLYSPFLLKPFHPQYFPFYFYIICFLSPSPSLFLKASFVSSRVSISHFLASTHTPSSRTHVKMRSQDTHTRGNVRYLSYLICPGCLT